MNLKTVLLAVILLCILTLGLVSTLYIKGAVRKINRAKEKANSAYDVEQNLLPPQEPAPAETQRQGDTQSETREEEAMEPETEQQAEGQTMTEYRLYRDKVWTKEKVDLTEHNDASSSVICRIAAKTQMDRIGGSDEWAFVEYQGQQGYVPQAKLTEEKLSGNGHTIVIDPGHQLKGNNEKEPIGPGSKTMKAKVTGGTRGKTTGVYEHQLTLDISLKLKQELEKRGYIVYMTRTTEDVDISNAERAEYAESVGSEILVRIHANGADDKSVSGAMALAPSKDNPYVSKLADKSQLLSKCILDHYCDSTGMKNQGVVKSDNMTGINWSTMPVTILEMGYMTNASDDKNMQKASYQDKMVTGIADGIDAYFKR